MYIGDPPLSRFSSVGRAFDCSCAKRYRNVTCSNQVIGKTFYVIMLRKKKTFMSVYYSGSRNVRFLLHKLK